MNARETVMSKEDMAALLRGMPSHPSNETGWLRFTERCLKAQAALSYKEGIRTVVEWLSEHTVFILSGATHLRVPIEIAPEWQAQLKEWGLG